MSKKLAIAALIFLAPATSFADNVGGCGVGAKLFAGQKGLAPNVMAVITDGFLDMSISLRPFAISTGTLGCSPDSGISSNWKTAMFIDLNKDRLARDMSIGSGEALDSLANLIGVRENDRANFGRVMQANVFVIFGSDSSTDDNLVALKQVLRSDRELAQYAASI
jgi:hypothetical protein